MRMARKYHALAVIFSHTNYVFAIGGFNENYLNTCEKYDELHDRWTYSASCEEYKDDVIAITRDNRYIFAFGGKGFDMNNYATRRFRKIQRLDVCAEEEGWQVMHVQIDAELSKEIWKRTFSTKMFHSFNSHDIFIFKGSNDTYVYNVTTSEIKKKSLACKKLEPREPSIERHGYIYYMGTECRPIYSHYLRQWMPRRKHSHSSNDE